MLYTLQITILFLILAVVVFAFVIHLPEIWLTIFKGMPPYISSEKRVYRIVKEYLMLADPERQWKIVELGSGDGRGLRLLTADNEWQATGYELAWRPYLLSLLGNYLSGNQKIKIYLADIKDADLSQADIIYTYLFKETDAWLEPKLLRELRPGTLVFSYAFTYPNLELLEDIRLDKLRHKELHVYRIPKAE